MRKTSSAGHKPNPGILGFLIGVQVTLAAIAWTDLALRPSTEVRGPKRRWALIIAINFAGPLAYLTWGRRPVDPATHVVEQPRQAS
ncbi:PLD nuclease N-terminal domain-containing protein [Amycolatopsis sp. NPDC049868]|uniref:PLD nuclease N-terminal domain-containing protein n=1 Tax=Amycolatopsis sp. NPDC049868 TaxID=3363934 RepID=UPI0037969990